MFKNPPNNQSQFFTNLTFSFKKLKIFKTIISQILTKLFWFSARDVVPPLKGASFKGSAGRAEPPASWPLGLWMYPTACAL